MDARNALGPGHQRVGIQLAGLSFLLMFLLLAGLLRLERLM